MKELARLIRKGLAKPGVEEDYLMWGAGRNNGQPKANVVGLALIGKLDFETACRLFEDALDEALDGKDEDGPNTRRILEELNLADTSQTERLVVLNGRKTARQIAEMLETGRLVLQKSTGIPKDKTYPEDSVQCGGCGGHGCHLCGDKGWLTPKFHPNGRKCLNDVCGKPIPPAHIAVYCCNECALADADVADADA